MTQDGFEIVLRVQISNEPRLNRSPSQPLLRLRAGGRPVHSKEESDPAKMIGCFLARFANDRYVQLAADDLSDLSSRYTLVCYAVIPLSSVTFLENEPVEMSSIEPMHSGPAVEPVAYDCGNTLFARDADQAWHKPVITVAVYRWRKPQHRCAHSTCRQRQCRLFRLAGKIGIGRILFCSETALALNQQGPASDDQRAIRARERGTERLNRAPVRFGSRRVVVKVVDEGGVDHAIRSGSSATKAFEIFERTAMYVGSRLEKRFGCCIRASEAEHPMTSVDQFSDDCRTDEACSSGDKNTHILFLLSIYELGR